MPTDLRVPLCGQVLGRKKNKKPKKHKNTKTDIWKWSSKPKSLFCNFILNTVTLPCLRKQLFSLPSGNQQVFVLPLIAWRHGRTGWLKSCCFSGASYCWDGLKSLSHSCARSWLRGLGFHWVLRQGGPTRPSCLQQDQLAVLRRYGLAVGHWQGVLTLRGQEILGSCTWELSTHMEPGAGGALSSWEVAAVSSSGISN